MSRFSPEWTIGLDLSWEQFRSVYPSVVRREKGLSGYGGLRPDIGSDYFGVLREQSFSFWNRTVVLEAFTGRMPVEGKLMEEKEGRITLLLRLMNYSLSLNYVKIVFWTLALSAITAFVLQRLVFLASGNGYFKYGGELLFALFLICIVPAWKGLLKLAHTSVAKKMNLCNDVLYEIERRARAGLGGES